MRPKGWAPICAGSGVTSADKIGLPFYLLDNIRENRTAAARFLLFCGKAAVYRRICPGTDQAAAATT